MSDAVEFLRSKGYPYKIKGNDGYVAYLVDIRVEAQKIITGLSSYRPHVVYGVFGRDYF